jgi:hypothetical protein
MHSGDKFQQFTEKASPETRINKHSGRVSGTLNSSYSEPKSDSGPDLGEAVRSFAEGPQQGRETKPGTFSARLYLSAHDGRSEGTGIDGFKVTKTQCTIESATESSVPMLRARARMAVRASRCWSSVSKVQAREMGHSKS